MVKLAADAAPAPPVDAGGGGVDPELHPATPSTPTASSAGNRTTRPRCAFMMYNTNTTPVRFKAVAKSAEGGGRPGCSLGHRRSGQWVGAVSTQTMGWNVLKVRAEPSLVLSSNLGYAVAVVGLFAL